MTFVPIGGHFTMDPKGAALAASYVKPREIVPMHYGTFPLLAGSLVTGSFTISTPMNSPGPRTSPICG